MQLYGTVEYCFFGPAAAGRPPLAVALLLVLGAPLLAFLVIEQQLAAASARWKRRVSLDEARRLLEERPIREVLDQ